MLPENITAIVARNERWIGEAATEPFEAGWAREAVFFVRALKEPVGSMPEAWVEISPDGIHWVAEGTRLHLPAEKDALSVARVSGFGNWLRLATRLSPDCSCTVLVALHLKA